LNCLSKPANDLRCVRIKEDGTQTRVFSNWLDGGFLVGSIGSVQSELWIWTVIVVLKTFFKNRAQKLFEK